jgi:hypothetical protein
MFWVFLIEVNDSASQKKSYPGFKKNGFVFQANPSMQNHQNH